MTKKIDFNDFVRRQTPESCFSHFEGTDEQLLRAVEINFDSAKQGYREGVLLVSVPPHGFLSGQVELKEGDLLVGVFEPRREGETPRKTLRVSRLNQSKDQAKAVEVVLYHRDVLGEEATTESEWEIISINARCTLEPEPIHPEVLMHNHFGSDGGTETEMSPEQFEAQMRESFNYWKNRALLA